MKKSQQSKTSTTSVIIVIGLAIILGYAVFTNIQGLQQEIPVMVEGNGSNQPTGQGGGEVIDEDLNLNLNNQNTNQAVTAWAKAQSESFALNYPASWQYQKQTESGIETHTFTAGDQEVIISLMDEGLKGIVEDSLSVTSQSTITVSGESAEYLEGADLKDGSPVYSVLLTKDGQLYNFSSADQEKLDLLLADFTLI